MLEYYAKEFSFTEINSSYYHMLSPHLFTQLTPKTPEDFIFTVKAYKPLTHEREESVKEDTKKFCFALESLLGYKKTGSSIASVS
ncbi:MAG TPA: hypothetical protein DCW46_00940 [Desulfotomaculum sp.]|nr:hypothetical protein [Desulfotomaculum sp.]